MPSGELWNSSSQRQCLTPQSLQAARQWSGHYSLSVMQTRHHLASQAGGVGGHDLSPQPNAHVKKAGFLHHKHTVLVQRIA